MSLNPSMVCHRPSLPVLLLCTLVSAETGIHAVPELIISALALCTSWYPKMVSIEPGMLPVLLPMNCPLPLYLGHPCDPFSLIAYCGSDAAWIPKGGRLSECSWWGKSATTHVWGLNTWDHHLQGKLQQARWKDYLEREECLASPHLVQPVQMRCQISVFKKPPWTSSPDEPSDDCCFHLTATAWQAPSESHPAEWSQPQDSERERYARSPCAQGSWASEQVERLAMMSRWVAADRSPDHTGLNPIRLLPGLPLEARRHGNGHAGHILAGSPSL